MAKAAKAPPPPEASLPPKLPVELAGLDRVIALLATIAKGDPLRRSLKVELEKLIGVLPHKATAHRWKSAVKEIRSELAQELKAEAASPTQTRLGEAGGAQGEA